MKKTTTIASLLSAACITAAAATAQAQINNGGFESGSFSGWTFSGNTGSGASQFALARDPINGGTQAPVSGEWAPRSGTWFAALWSTDSAGSSFSTLTQSFTAPAGQTIEFDVFFDFGDWAPNYDAGWAVLNWDGGSQTLIAFNTAFANELADDTNIDWTHVSFTLPLSGAYTLEFHVTDTDGAFESIMGVDNVELIPAPGAAVTAGLGLAGLFGRRRRR